RKRVGDVGDPRKPISVRTDAAREDAARTISQYDLLAVPVLDEADHVLGIATVDDVIDAIVQEQTEHVQRFGRVQAVAEPDTDAMALRELSLKDWWRVAVRELPSGLLLGAILGAIGVLRITLWQALGWYDYGPHHLMVALTVGTALVGVVTFGSLAGSMLPFLLRRLGFDPASASAPFVATLVDVTGLVIYFSVAMLILRGTLL